MSIIVSHEGEIQLLTDLLSAGENWTLKLFSNNITPAEGDTAATYTEATFTGYSAVTLTRSISGTTWSTPTGTGSILESGCAKSQYNPSTPIQWTATSTQNIYGYYYVGATSGKLIMAELFASIAYLAATTVIDFTPGFELAT